MRHRFWISLLPALLFAGVNAGRATEAPRPMTVHIAPDKAGLSLRFTLPAPVAAMTFGWSSQGLRAEVWRLEPGLTLAGETVTRADGGPVTALSLAMVPDRRMVDRTYPLLTSDDDGIYILNSRYLFGPGKGDINLTVDAGVGGMVAGHGLKPVDDGRWSGTLSADDAGSILIVRDARRMEKDGILCGTGLPAWLCQEVKEKAQVIAQFYHTRTGFAPQRSPLVVATWHPGDDESEHKGSWRGDASGGIINLRFTGPMWQMENPATRKQVASFLAHEYFHLWQQEGPEGGSGTLRDLAMEGGAEYASLLLLRDLDWIDEGEFLARVVDSVNACAIAAGSRPIGEMPSAGSRLVYDCGLMLFWAGGVLGGDPLMVRDRFFAGWQPPAGGHRLDAVALTSLFDAPGTAAARFSASFLTGKDWTRWSDLFDRLIRHDSRFDRREAASETFRYQAMMHALRASCTGPPFGFWTWPDGLVLSSDDRCGELSGNPKVTTLLDRVLTGNGKDVYDALAEACRRGESMRFRTEAGLERTGGPCTRAPPSVPDRLVVR